MSVQSVAIVGGGLAGFTTARELRTKGFTGRITLIDAEGLPYDRPPLSKDYLSGEQTAEKILLAPASWYAEHEVTIITARAQRLDADADTGTVTVTLDTGETVTADAVVLATGGTARGLPVPGGDLESLLTLRTRQDSDTLREQLRPGTSMAIIGAGLIGAEVASTARAQGVEVTIIDPLDPPLVPAVGQEIAERLHGMHAEHGVRAVHGVSAGITQDERGFQVHLQDGQAISADLVLVGIGIIAETSLAAEAGLEVDNGIIVDVSQRTSHPRVFAVGDCARTRAQDGTLQRRAEHWEHAMHTGMTAAAALLDRELPQHPSPWFWSDRYDVHVEGVGSLYDEGSTVIRGSADAPAAAFRVSEDGLLLGCAAIDDAQTVRAARRIIDRRIPVAAEQLADPGTELKKIARQRT